MQFLQINIILIISKIDFPWHEQQKKKQLQVVYVPQYGAASLLEAETTKAAMLQGFPDCLSGLAPASSAFSDVTNICHMWFALSHLLFGEGLRVQGSVLPGLYFFLFLLLHSPGCI